MPFKTVPCKFCEQPTEMIGTSLCHNCWEVEGRLRTFMRSPKGEAHVYELLADKGGGLLHSLRQIVYKLIKSEPLIFSQRKIVDRILEDLK